jgi:hypothetical protein
MNNNGFSINKDNYYNNLHCINTNKIPVYANINILGNNRGLEGNIVIESSTGNFYWHDGKKWSYINQNNNAENIISGNNTQILTTVNNKTIWSYPGYNYFGSNFIPSQTFDISSIVTTPQTNKYWGACLAPNGNIYCIPWGATNVGIIDPINETINITTISGITPTNKYIGGVCGPNGNIYCMTSGFVRNVGVINTMTNTFSSINLPYSGPNFAYAGGVLATNGKIYGIPYSDSKILIINPLNNDISFLETGQNSTFKWGSGVLASNGKIYCMPHNFTTVAIIDTSNNTIDTSTFPSLSGSGLYFGGVLAPNGRIYCIPRNASNVGIIDTSNNTIDVSSISFTTYPFLANTDKYMGGVLGMDGLIYCIPWGNTTTNVGIIDPSTNTFNNISISAPAGANKYTGGILGPNGKIYCPPHTQANIGIIKTNFPTLLPWMIAPEFNKL